MIQANRKFYTIAFLLVFVSLVIHTYLTFHHFQIRYMPQLGPSACNINSSFNCDAVAVSKYSTFLGIPLAALGLVSHLVLLGFLIISRFSLSVYSGTYERLSFFLSFFIALMSIVMGVISTVLVKNYCLFCIGAYIISFITFGVILLIKSEEKKSFSVFAQELIGPAKKGFVAVLLTPLFAWALSGMIAGQLGSGKMSELKIRSVAYWKEAALNTFNNEAGLILKTDGISPKMTIVEFADFLCPHCKVAGPPLKSFVSSRSDTQLVFKFYPLDSACNSAISSESRGGARCLLAGATHCAEKLHQLGWKMYERIFEFQEDFADNSQWPDIWNKLKSPNLPIDEEKFSECVRSEQTFEEIRSQAREGDAAKITGTPAIFVNGKKLDFGQLPAVLEEVYKEIN